MGELPHLKALVERHGGEPFALIGINTDSDKDLYRHRAEEHGVTWRSSWQGSTGGPIPEAWGVNSYPTVFVLDSEHVIRNVGARGERLAQVVSELLAEAKAKEEENSGG